MATKGEAPPSKISVKEQTLGDVLDFMRLLWAVDHGLRSASKRMEARLGITGPQRLTIRLVGRFPGISAGELAGLLHIHPSTLTGILSRLENGGFLERKVDPSDGRRALFTLTLKGKDLDTVTSGAIEPVVERVLTRQAPRKLASAKEILIALAKEILSFQEEENGAPTGSPRPGGSNSTPPRRSSTK